MRTVTWLLLDINLNVYINVNGTKTQRIMACFYTSVFAHQKNIIEGTVHKIFRSTSTWELYHEAMMINRLQWKENQHPEEWSSKVESETLRKVLGQNLYQLRRKPGQQMTSETRNPQCSCFNIEEIEVNCLETRFAASPRHKLCLRPEN